MRWFKEHHWAEIVGGCLIFVLSGAMVVGAILLALAPWLIAAGFLVWLFKACV